MSPKQRRLVGVLSLVALIVVVLAVLAPSLYEVQDKGRGPAIVPYEGTGLIYKIRVLDSVTVYADSESRPIPDKLSASVLATSMCGSSGSRSAARRLRSSAKRVK